MKGVKLIERYMSWNSFMASKLGDRLPFIVGAANARSHLEATYGSLQRFDASHHDACERKEAGTTGKLTIVRSQTYDIFDLLEYFVAHAQHPGVISVDCSIHGINLVL